MYTAVHAGLTPSGTRRLLALGIARAPAGGGLPPLRALARLHLDGNVIGDAVNSPAPATHETQTATIPTSPVAKPP